MSGLGDGSSTSTPREPPRSVPLSDLVDRARHLAQSRRRTIIGITGAPGAGKSTVSDALLAALGADAVLVGMDGFHLSNDELVRLGRRDRKGAPDTFDVDGYVALLQRLRRQIDGTIYAPVFDRANEVSMGSCVPVPAATSLVITEGNYLLLDGHGWSAVRDCLDESWFLDVPPSVRAARLVARRQSYGDSESQAQAWVHGVDEVNAELVNATRERPSLVVELDPDQTCPGGPSKGC